MAQQQKFRYRGLDEAGQELLKDTRDAFEALPNREAQIEHILDALGITGTLHLSLPCGVA